MLANYLVSGVALDALCPRVPAENVAFLVECKNGVVVYALYEQAMKVASLVRNPAGCSLVRGRSGIE
jgi:hypothetical protein